MNDICITGANGFIGRHLSNFYFQKGWQVTGVGIKPFLSNYSHIFHNYYNLKLPNKKLNLLLKKHTPQIIIHCAGSSSVHQSIHRPLDDFQKNVAVTVNLLEAIRSSSPDSKLIILSSAAVYGNPTHMPITESTPAIPISPYGYHKRMCEIACEEYNKLFNLKISIIRLFSAYGPGLERQVIWDMLNQIFFQKSLNLKGTGNETRDFLHIHDIISAIHQLISKVPFEAEKINLAFGKSISIQQLSKKLLSLINVKVPVFFDGNQQLGVPKFWQADTTQMHQLGFYPKITLNRGLTTVYQWFKTQFIN